MVAERFQDRIDALFSPLHGAEHLVVAGFGLRELLLAFPSQVGAGILAEFGLPFREERIRDTFDVFDAFSHGLGAVFTGLQLAIELLIGGFQLSALIGHDLSELLQGSLNIFLRLFLCVTGRFDPAAQDIALGIAHLIHRGDIGRVAA